jgi:hypothetical protein
MMFGANCFIQGITGLGDHSYVTYRKRGGFVYDTKESFFGEALEVRGDYRHAAIQASNSDGLDR